MLPLKKRPIPPEYQFTPCDLRRRAAIQYPTYYTSPPPSTLDAPEAPQIPPQNQMTNTTPPSIPSADPRHPSPPAPAGSSRLRILRSEMVDSSKPQAPPPRRTSRTRRPNQRYHTPSPPQTNATSAIPPSTAATQHPSRDTPPTNGRQSSQHRSSLTCLENTPMDHIPNGPCNADDQGSDHEPPRNRPRSTSNHPTTGATSTGSSAPLRNVPLPILPPLRSAAGVPHPSAAENNVQQPYQSNAEFLWFRRAIGSNRRSTAINNTTDIPSNPLRTLSGNPTPNRSETNPQRARQTNARETPSLKSNRRKRKSIPDNTHGEVESSPRKRQRTTSNEQKHGITSVGSSVRRQSLPLTMPQPSSSGPALNASARNAKRKRQSQTVARTSAHGSNRLTQSSMSSGSSAHQGMTETSEEIRPCNSRPNHPRRLIAQNNTNPIASPRTRMGPPAPPGVVDNTLPCDICNVRFCNAQAVRRHKRSQHAPANRRHTSVSCPECNGVFKSRQNLSRHMKVHEGGANILCPECNAKFRTERSRTTHRREVHNVRTAPRGPATVSYTCPNCDYASNQRTNVNRHYDSIHLKLKPYACPFPGCNVKASTHANIEAHQTSHLNQGDVLESDEWDDEDDEGPDPVDETCEPDGGNPNPSDDDDPDGPGCTQGPIPVR